MAKRKSRKPQPEDLSVLLETPAEKPKIRTNSFAAPALLFIITLTVGACIMGWFCVQQQQQSIEQLSESFTTMKQRITNFQQVMDMEDAQSDPGLLVEERIFALEEAQKQAQEKAEVALATSEELKNSDLLSQLWALHAEMNTRWDEIKQAALSVTTLQGMFKNQSEAFEVMKERVVAGLSFSSALSETVDDLTSTCSRLAEQDASVEALNAQLEGQASKLSDLRELLYLHNVALHSHNQEMAAIKELVKAKQAMRAQALEETLSSVRMILDEQFFTSQTLHSRIMAQLHTFHSELANGPSLPINHKPAEEGHPAEELVSATAQNVSELQEEMEAAQEKAEEEEEDVEDDTEEQAKEDVMQEEQLPEERVDGDVIQTQEEDEIAPEEQAEEEITGQSEEQEDAGETADEETDEETEEETADEETEEETADEETDEETEEETADEETEEETEEETADEETEEETADEETDEETEEETADEETEEETEEETADEETEEETDEETEEETADEERDEETADEETADEETEEETADEERDEETADEETADEETEEETEETADEETEEETAEANTAEENTSDHVLEESSEEEVSKDEENSADLNSDSFMDTQEEDE